MEDYDFVFYKFVDVYEVFLRIEDDERIRNVVSKSYEKENFFFDKFFVEVEFCMWKFKGEIYFINGVSWVRLGEDFIWVWVGVEYLKKYG